MKVAANNDEKVVILDNNDDEDEDNSVQEFKTAEKKYTVKTGKNFFEQTHYYNLSSGSGLLKNRLTRNVKEKKIGTKNELNFSLSTQCSKFLVFLKKKIEKKTFSLKELKFHMREFGIISLQNEVLDKLNEESHMIKNGNSYTLL